MEITNDREVWVDNVKANACILVVLGHFFQSMVKAGIYQDNILYQWFDQTITISMFHYFYLFRISVSKIQQSRNVCGLEEKCNKETNSTWNAVFYIFCNDMGIEDYIFRFSECADWRTIRHSVFISFIAILVFILFVLCFYDHTNVLL